MYSAAKAKLEQEQQNPKLKVALLDVEATVKAYTSLEEVNAAIDQLNSRQCRIRLWRKTS